VGHRLPGWTPWVQYGIFLTGKDPLEFYLQLLKRHPRPRRVLEISAEKGHWGILWKKGPGRGIAQHFSFGIYGAQVAEVSVNEKDGRVKVHRIVCPVDCGPVINPNIVTAGVEGGVIFGLSDALKEAISFTRGGVKLGNFHDYEILSLNETPEGANLEGVGEPGVPPVASAMGNAVFAAARYGYASFR
jgi:isoquinoline 1-oxidoreductase beta subunit